MQELTHLRPAEMAALQPLLQAQVTLAAEELFQTRRALAEQLAAIEDEAAGQLSDLRAAEASAAEVLQAIEPKYSAARDRYQLAAQAVRLAEGSFGHRRDTILRKLRAATPPAIDELEGELRHAYRTIPNDLHYSQRSAGGPPMFRDGQFVHPQVTVGNISEIDGRMATIRAALRECEQLRHEAVEPDELNRRLEAIRRRCLAPLLG